MSMKFAPIAVLCLSLSGAGCIHFPYAFLSNPTRSIHGVRVLDAVTEEDIAGSQVSVTIHKTNGNPTALWSSGWLDQDEAREAIGDGELARQPSGLFTVPRRRVWGYQRLFGLTTNHQYPRSDPYACIVACAPGYHAVQYRSWDRRRPPLPFTVSTGRETAITGHRSSDTTPLDGDYIEVARCIAGEDGVLRFYLRKIRKEIEADPIFFTDQDKRRYMESFARAVGQESAETVIEQPSSDE